MNLNYSGFYIRDLIYQKILDNTIHELLFSFNSNSFCRFPTNLSHRQHLISNTEFLYHYHLTNLLALEVGKLHYHPIRYANNTKGVHEVANSLAVDDSNSETYVVEVIMQNDLQKVNLFYATVAWLSIDDFRWHKLPPFSHIPEDLSYGLVSDYPDMILPYAAFISKVDRYPALELLDSSTIELVKETAKISV